MCSILDTPSSRPTFINHAESKASSYSLYFQAQEDEKSLCQSDWSADASMDQPSYGSIVYQLKEANIESESSCDFIRKFSDIVQSTSKYIWERFI